MWNNPQKWTDPSGLTAMIEYACMADFGVGAGGTAGTHGASGLAGVFSNAVDTPSGRWDALRSFVTVWGGVKLSPTRMSEFRLAKAEKAAERALPFALRESIEFYAELEESTDWQGFKFDLQKRADLEAILLGTYCDDDWYIGILDHDMVLDDPPIQFYMPREASGLHLWQKIASSISSYVLFGLLGPLSSVKRPGSRYKFGTFHVEVTPTDDWLAEMRAAFHAVARLGEYIIFEKPDLLIIVGPEYHLPEDQGITSMNGLGAGDSGTVPACVARHMGNGGSFSGMFGPHLAWPFREATKS